MERNSSVDSTMVGSCSTNSFKAAHASASASRRRMRKKRILYRLRKKGFHTSASTSGCNGIGDDTSVPLNYRHQLHALQEEARRDEQRRQRRKAQKLKRKQWEDDPTMCSTSAYQLPPLATATATAAATVTVDERPVHPSSQRRRLNEMCDEDDRSATDIEEEEQETSMEAKMDTKQAPNAVQNGFFSSMLHSALQPVKRVATSIWRSKPNDEIHETAPSEVAVVVNEQKEHAPGKSPAKKHGDEKSEIDELREAVKLLRAELNALKSSVHLTTVTTSSSSSSSSLSPSSFIPPAPLLDIPQAPPPPSPPQPPPPSAPFQSPMPNIPNSTLVTDGSATDQPSAALGLSVSELLSVRLKRRDENSTPSSKRSCSSSFQVTADMLSGVKLRRTPSKPSAGSVMTAAPSPLLGSPLVSLSQLAAVKLKRTDADRSPGGTPRKHDKLRARPDNDKEWLMEQLAKKFRRSPWAGRQQQHDNDDIFLEHKEETDKENCPAVQVDKENLPHPSVCVSFGQQLESIPESLCSKPNLKPTPHIRKRSQANSAMADHSHAPLSPVSDANWDSPYVPSGRAASKWSALKNAKRNLQNINM